MQHGGVWGGRVSTFASNGRPAGLGGYSHRGSVRGGLGRALVHITGVTWRSEQEGRRLDSAVSRGHMRMTVEERGDEYWRGLRAQAIVVGVLVAGMVLSLLAPVLTVVGAFVLPIATVIVLLGEVIWVVVSRRWFFALGLAIGLLAAVAVAVFFVAL